MSKHSAQFKLEVVDDYLRVGSYQRVAKTHGIQTTDVRKWVLAYRHHGSASLYRRVYQQYPPAFKVEVLEYLRTHGLSPRFGAAHFNIASPSTILVWQRLYNEGGITALQSKRNNPAFGKTCHYCKKKNHFQSDCHKRKRENGALVKVRELENKEDDPALESIFTSSKN